MHIIDRRLNPRGKSLVNRQRFLRRARALVRKAVRDSLGSRGIRDVDKEGEVGIPPDSIDEPRLRRGDTGGNRDHVLPGNRVFQAGDRIKRPPAGGGGAGGSSAGSGDGEDAFRFVLSREEFLDLFLEDLELPDLVKRQLTASEAFDVQRAGFTTVGSPAALSVPRTMRRAMSRRIALRRPSRAEIETIEQELAALEKVHPGRSEDKTRLTQLRDRHAELSRRYKLISYIDPIDLRYRRFEHKPRPITQAVMFCLMDVSGSMNEHMKELAKIFFILLYLFISRCYKHVEIVFIRHTDKADEVDEETFFYSTETGGTRVSTALEQMLAIVEDRYSPADWNIYVAQASDGDNFTSDNQRVLHLMRDRVLPLAQYVAYLEVGSDIPPMRPMGATSNLWETYASLADTSGRFAMRKVHNRKDVYPVFRDLFQRRAGAAA
jgi:uncharacterized protein